MSSSYSSFALVPVNATATGAPSVGGDDAEDSRRFCRTTLWHIVVGAAAAVYFTALLAAVLHSVVSSSCAAKRPPKEREDEKRRKLLGKQHGLSVRTRVQLQCTALVKGSNCAGKILLAMYSMCVVASFVVYLLMTYQFVSTDAAGVKSLLACHSPCNFAIIHVDFAINVFYAAVFVCRLISSDSKLNFLLSLTTVADHLTLIPSFIMYSMSTYMIAFQFARLGGLKFLVNALIYCQILKGERQIRIMKMILQIIITWLASAGFFQLLESVGDFWLHGGGASTSTFLEFHVCFYTMLLTMSTVGYGDYTPRTVLAKFFIIIFIIVALGLFASIIPELSAIMTESRKYRRNKIHLMHGRKHIVLTGRFDLPTVDTFFEDFYHEGRSDNKKHFVAVLGEEEPSPEMKNLLKPRELYVTYLQGNVMCLRDLKRAELRLASAVIILTDGRARDPEDEDMMNIMRVIAVKDYCPDMRVLVQLHLYRSKTYLRNIPDWNCSHGDQALCINEMKYGVLAQSCLVPGVSTLMGNLLTLRRCDSARAVAKQGKPGSWEAEYCHGVEFEFYKVKFAPLFQGLTFLEACRLCYDQLGVLLLAVQLAGWEGGREPGEGRRTVINPGSRLLISVTTMEAFVIARDRKEAKSVSRLLLSPEELAQAAATGRYFSLSASARREQRPRQHEHEHEGEHEREHEHEHKHEHEHEHKHDHEHEHEQEHKHEHEHEHEREQEHEHEREREHELQTQQHLEVRPQRSASCSGVDQNSLNQLELKSVNSNLTDKPVSTSREASLYDPQLPPSRSHSGIFHAAIQSRQSSCSHLDSSGYFHWIPNRSAGSIMLSNQERYRFRNHIVVCIVDKRPDVLLNITSFIMPLRASTIPSAELKDIVFLGNVDLVFREWSIVQNFPGIYALDGSPLNRANLKAINIEYVDCCVVLSPRAHATNLTAQVDRETVLCTLNIKTMQHPETGRKLGDTIHIITELNSVGSIEYLDQDDETEVEEPFMTQAFATGRTFYLSLLGSIATTIYFNEAALSFLRTILTTVDSDGLEAELNEQGFHFMSPEHADFYSQPGHCADHKGDGADPQLRSRIQLFSVCEPLLQRLYRGTGEGCQWRHLLMRCLEQLEIVCIGLYRLQVPKPGAKNHRFVIAMPMPSMEVLDTDKVYCLTPPGFKSTAAGH